MNRVEPQGPSQATHLPKSAASKTAVKRETQNPSSIKKHEEAASSNCCVQFFQAWGTFFLSIWSCLKALFCCCCGKTPVKKEEPPKKPASTPKVKTHVAAASTTPSSNAPASTNKGDSVPPAKRVSFDDKNIVETSKGSSKGATSGSAKIPSAPASQATTSKPVETASTTTASVAPPPADSAVKTVPASRVITTNTPPQPTTFIPVETASTATVTIAPPAATSAPKSDAPSSEVATSAAPQSTISKPPETLTAPVTAVTSPAPEPAPLKQPETAAVPDHIALNSEKLLEVLKAPLTDLTLEKINTLLSAGVTELARNEYLLVKRRANSEKLLEMVKKPLNNMVSDSIKVLVKEGVTETARVQSLFLLMESLEKARMGTTLLKGCVEAIINEGVDINAEINKFSLLDRAFLKVAINGRSEQQQAAFFDFLEILIRHEKIVVNVEQNYLTRAIKNCSENIGWLGIATEMLARHPHLKKEKGMSGALVFKGASDVFERAKTIEEQLAFFKLLEDVVGDEEIVFGLEQYAQALTHCPEDNKRDYGWEKIATLMIDRHPNIMKERSADGLSGPVELAMIRMDNSTNSQPYRRIALQLVGNAAYATDYTLEKRKAQLETIRKLQNSRDFDQLPVHLKISFNDLGEAIKKKLPEDASAILS